MAENKTDPFGGLKKPDDAVNFPSPFTDPAIKASPKYCLQYMQALYYNNWLSTDSPYGNAKRLGWAENRSFSNGVYNVLPYAFKPTQRDDNSGAPAQNHIDFSQFSEIPKLRDIFVSYAEEIDYDITATAINPLATDEKQKLVRKVRAHQKLSDFKKKIEAISGTKIAPESPIPYEAQSSEETELLLKFGLKFIPELMVELGNREVLLESEMEDVYKLLAEDIFDLGIAMIDTDVDTSGRIKATYIDPLNSGFESFRGHYNKNLSRFWYLTTASVAQVLADSSGQINRAQAEVIAKKYQNLFGNPSWNTANATTGMRYINTDGAYFYDTWKVPVLKGVWEDTNCYKYVNGKPVPFSSQPDVTESEFQSAKQEGNGAYQSFNSYTEYATDYSQKIEETYIHTYYRTTWIVDTDIVYNYGVVPYLSRNPFDLKKALCPIKIYRVSDQSMCERLKPLAKQIINYWDKFQAEAAAAIPSGYKINVKAIDNISLGDGKKLSRKHVIEIFEEKGRMIYSDEGVYSESGQALRKDPVEWLNNVDINALKRWIDAIEFVQRQMYTVSGLNEYANANQPNPSGTATGAKIAAQGAQKALQQMVDGLTRLSEKIAIDVSCKLKMMVEAGDYEIKYASTIGSGYSIPAITKSILPYTMGIKVTAKPLDDERQEMKQVLGQSLNSTGDVTKGGIMPEQWFALSRMIDDGNLKEAEVMAAYFTKVNFRRMQEMAAANSQASAQNSQASAQQAADSKLQLEQALSQMRMQENDHETGNAIKLATVTAGAHGQVQQNNLQLKSELKKDEKSFEAGLG